jgi:hypothetical protein
VSLEFAPASAPADGVLRPITQSGTESLASSLAVSLGAIAAVVGTSALAVRLWRDPGFSAGRHPGGPVEGLTIFAVFFVAASALERLLEPLASLVGNRPRQEASAQRDAAQKKVDLAGAVAGDLHLRAEAETAVQQAAAAQAASEVATANRKVLFWALASILGIAAAASMKLYLLTTTGIAAPSRWMEVLATGLIVGAGTKPLHDLVELISAKKDLAKDNPG